MAITVIEDLRSTWYTPQSQLDSDNPARFKLRRPDGSQMGYLRQEIGVTTDGKMDITGRGIDLALSYCLEDWDGVEDSRGPVKCTPGNHRLLPLDIRLDLAMEIIRMGTLTEDERKN